MLFNRAAERPTPLDSEAFWNLTNLIHPDPTHVLPVAIGLLTMALTDSTRWFLPPRRLAELDHADMLRAERARRSLLKLNWSATARSASRCWAVARIPIAMLAPGVRHTSCGEHAEKLTTQ